MTIPVDPAPTPPSRSRLVARTLLALAIIAALIVVGRLAGDRLPAFAGWVDSLGVWGPLVFIVGYAAATVAFVPGSVLTLAAGAVFGLVAGVAYALAGAVIGASAAFLIARYLAREAVQARIARSPRFSAVNTAVGANGRRIVLLLRLSPVVPFNVLNYALGVTRVRFVDYLIASVGMIPGTVLYVYYGRVAGTIATAVAGRGMNQGRGYQALLVVGLVATVVVTALITRLASRALREAEGGSTRGAGPEA